MAPSSPLVSSNFSALKRTGQAPLGSLRKITDPPWAYLPVRTPGAGADVLLAPAGSSCLWPMVNEFAEEQRRHLLKYKIHQGEQAMHSPFGLKKHLEADVGAGRVGGGECLPSGPAGTAYVDHLEDVASTVNHVLLQLQHLHPPLPALQHTQPGLLVEHRVSRRLQAQVLVVRLILQEEDVLAGHLTDPSGCILGFPREAPAHNLPSSLLI
ncbi:uncharacterized protein [Desmodus rotundus]|uniref:uncharacterized protein isoform X2 n=1 Tax=Desmodus rotundus TaxID=9430 RepID=UPI002381771F|nr:uncharacterized protein LOC128779522 isoform X2 [Desmodus rotundus]